MKRSNLTIMAVAIALVAGAVGFGVGRTTAPKAATAAAASGNGRFGGGAGGTGGTGFGGGTRRAGGRPVFGTVASLSGTALVITDTSGATHNVTLSSTTMYTSGDGAAASQSSLTAGTSVAAFGTAATDGTVTATRVIINPNIPSGGAGAPGAGSGSSQVN